MLKVSCCSRDSLTTGVTINVALSDWEALLEHVRGLQADLTASSVHQMAHTRLAAACTMGLCLAAIATTSQGLISTQPLPAVLIGYLRSCLGPGTHTARSTVVLTPAEVLAPNFAASIVNTQVTPCETPRYMRCSLHKCAMFVIISTVRLAYRCSAPSPL